MSANDFDGLGFAAGTVRGVRSWRVDDYGRLRAIHQDAWIWKPGENKAGCTQRNGKHSMGDCGCGFYAYYDGSNDYRSSAGPRGVSGVVEGYGECVIGTRGFRAGKARIVALSIDKPGWTPHDLFRHGPIYRRGLRADDDNAAALGVLFFIVGALGAVAATIGGIQAHQPWLFALTALSVLLLSFAGTLFQAAGDHFDDTLLRRYGADIHKSNRWKPDEPLARLKENYPDVKFFNSFDQMVRAFPPDNGMKDRTPATDPDFWTRK